MSDWGGLPILAPPEYLDKKIQFNSDSELKFYSSELGFTNDLKRIKAASLVTTHVPFTDPHVVRSEAWSDVEFIQPKKKRRWIRLKSKFSSCIKSTKCRFTTLGLFLGIILSLCALIPIVVVWQTSNSGSNPTTSSSVYNGVASSLNISTNISKCDSYYCEEQVTFTTNMTITSLLLTVTIQRTGNTTYFGTFNSYNTIINSTYTVSSTQIIYTFFIGGSQLLLANTYSCSVQFSLPGLNHTTSYDTYSIQVTNICGVITSASGNFQ